MKPYACTRPDADGTYGVLRGMCTRCGAGYERPTPKAGRLPTLCGKCPASTSRSEAQPVTAPCVDCGVPVTRTMASAYATPDARCRRCITVRTYTSGARQRPTHKACKDCGKVKPWEDFHQGSKRCTECWRVFDRTRSAMAHASGAYGEWRRARRARALAALSPDTPCQCPRCGPTTLAAYPVGTTPAQAARKPCLPCHTLHAQQREQAHWLLLLERCLRRDMAKDRAKKARKEWRYSEQGRAAIRRYRPKQRKREHDTVAPAFVRRVLRKRGWIAPHQPIPKGLQESMRLLLLIRRTVAERTTHHG